MLACRSIRRLIAAALGIGSATVVCAQTPASPAPAQTVVVRVHVADSAGTPIAGAEVSVVHGLTRIVARGLSNASGEQSFTIPRTGADHELVVRKIGYRRADQFFNDSMASPAFRIVLERAPATFDTVRVVAREDPVRKSYYIDADQIEQSPRLVDNALDIVTKLRPDMIWGRAGLPDQIDMHVAMTGRQMSRSPGAFARQAAKWGYCPAVASVWVNGSRIRDVPIDMLAYSQLTGRGKFINATIASVLASIKPEHIAEVQYHPCTEAVAGTPAQATNAIFVTLKPGVGFQPGIGSYVVTSAPPLRVAGPILGVYDERSGAPLSDVQVVDVASGTSALTTQTGTVTLAFMAAGQGTVRIIKPGYDTLSVPVTISPVDTTPITVVLTRPSSLHARP